MIWIKNNIKMKKLDTSLGNETMFHLPSDLLFVTGWEIF